MEIMEFITQMYMPLVVVACLAVGYIVKKWVKDVDNKYIPTIVFILGAVLACVANRQITIELIVAGSVSGLASTGMHQMFAQLIDKE